LAAEKRKNLPTLQSTTKHIAEKNSFRKKKNIEESNKSYYGYVKILYSDR
jgi:hypothetical protein